MVKFTSDQLLAYAITLREKRENAIQDYVFHGRLLTCRNVYETKIRCNVFKSEYWVIPFLVSHTPAPREKNTNNCLHNSEEVPGRRLHIRCILPNG